MKVAVFLFFACTLVVGFVDAQQLKTIPDSTKAKLTINSVCLCDTKLGDLRTTASDFKEVEVDEMDSPKTCYGEDSRYTNGKGIQSAKFPGMIFQEGNVDGYIGKIRLTKAFKGKLPNGAEVDLSTMKLRDVFIIYPQLKESWGSRDCSDYWHFSDKTISFFVKIDASIPRYPAKEADYIDKPIEGIDLVASCYKLLVPSKPIQFFKPDEPMIFIDSIRTNQSFVENAYTPDEIASINVIKGETAIKIGGEEAKNGIIYIQTKHGAMTKAWALFRKVSEPYAKAVKSPADPDVVYVLNGEVLTDNYEDELSSIKKAELVEIQVIDKKQLKKQFDKKGRVGVLLTTKK